MPPHGPSSIPATSKSCSARVSFKKQNYVTHWPAQNHIVNEAHKPPVEARAPNLQSPPPSQALWTSEAGGPPEPHMHCTLSSPSLPMRYSLHLKYESQPQLTPRTPSVTHFNWRQRGRPLFNPQGLEFGPPATGGPRKQLWVSTEINGSLLQKEENWQSRGYRPHIT